MKLSELSTRLQASHHHDLQACATILAAVGAVENGLALLARLGHVYHLEPGPPYELPEWPRVLFHVENAPNGRVVNSWWEANDLGPGWWPTLAEAAHREGVRAQFAGRGGIGDRSLPMLVDGGPAGPRPDPGTSPKTNGGIIDEWKRSIERVRSEGQGLWGEVTVHDGRTAEPSRTGGNGVAAAPDAGPSLSRQPGLGDQGPGDNGSEAGVHVTRSTPAGGISEDAIPSPGIPAGGNGDGSAEAGLRRVLSSSARTLADSRAARDAATPPSANH